MQTEMPEVFDLSKETDATLDLYGLERGQTEGFALAVPRRPPAGRARRALHRADRPGSSNNWDAHGDMKTHEPLAKNVDQPIAGLLSDLKRRGMLDDTLVVWTTEFGRTPDDRRRRGAAATTPRVFSSWLAGGGVKGGMVYGKTDESAARSPRTRSTSTTSTPRSCTCSASTTRS